MVDEFHHFGYPDWIRLLVGVVEVVGSVLLLVPRTAFIGAGLLSCVMVGAVASHIAFREFAFAIIPFVLLLLLAVLGQARRSPHRTTTSSLSGSR